MTLLRITFVEWPEALTPTNPRCESQWLELKNSVTAARPDILVTNELPFGPWLADARRLFRRSGHSQRSRS